MWQWKNTGSASVWTVKSRACPNARCNRHDSARPSSRRRKMHRVPRGMTMKPFYACNSSEHAVSRRQFLAGSATTLGLLGFKGMLTPANAEAIRRQDKRVLVVFLSGGSSQLETWDPKPGT